MYVLILQFVFALVVSVVLAFCIRMIRKYEEERRLQSFAKEVSSQAKYRLSSSGPDEDETTRVDQYVYPRVFLPADSQLRPTSRPESDAPTEYDYHILTQNRTELRLTTSIAVSYEGTEFVIDGNSDSIDNSKPELKKQGWDSDSFGVRLNQGTPVMISNQHDSVGLIKRLEADQEFKIMPGSVICIPAGCQIRFRQDQSRTKFLTKDSMHCTLLPPLNGGAGIPSGSITAQIHTRKN